MEEYKQWLRDNRRYTEPAIATQMSRLTKVEQYCGSLNDHFINGTYQNLIEEFKYSRNDERNNKQNPSRVPINEATNLYNRLQSYKFAIILYQRFLSGGVSVDYEEDRRSFSEAVNCINSDNTEVAQQRLSLERDMQVALRKNIACLATDLKIIDEGIERSVESGFIDITCEDGNGIVVIELKAGKADSRAIGQILGYMGDMMEEEERPVRGILIANDFDTRTKSAAKAVSSLTLKKYAIEFKFVDAE